MKNEHNLFKAKCKLINRQENLSTNLKHFKERSINNRAKLLLILGQNTTCHSDLNFVFETLSKLDFFAGVIISLQLSPFLKSQIAIS